MPVNPTEDAAYAAIAEILTVKLGVPVERLHPEATYTGLELDSLAVIEVFVDLGERFGVYVPDEHAVSDLTLAETARLTATGLALRQVTHTSDLLP